MERLALKARPGTEGRAEERIAKGSAVRPGGTRHRARRAFGARFVEVRVDPELGLLRIARIVSAIDAGRVVNEKLARSQIIGGTVGGIGMAMFEDTITDADSGRSANATFGDYLVAVK